MKRTIETKFRLYSKNKSKFNSTIFDLIDGDRETKQTKGLAYLFSHYSNFALSFIELEPIKNEIEKKLGKTIDIKQISKIEISAEKFTKSKLRADIVLKIIMNDKLSFAIIIEAKSIKVKSNQNIIEQISNYLEEGEIEDLKTIPKIGVILTKYKYNYSNIVSVEWYYLISFISEFLKKNKESNLIQQYYNFITKIEKEMEFFEKEVLSIPAGKSFEKIEEHNIYECPNNKNYSYKKPIFVTFRKTESVMEYLYRVDDIIVLNPTDKEEVEALKNSTIEKEVIDRIINYIEEPNYNLTENIEKRFYVLSKEKIELKHKPKPKMHIQKHTYFTLNDILTKNKLIPESQNYKSLF